MTPASAKSSRVQKIVLRLAAGILWMGMACGGGATTQPTSKGIESGGGSGIEEADAIDQKTAPGTDSASVTDPAPAREEPVPELVFPQGEAFRKTRPAPGEVRAFKLPAVEQFKLKNGVRVYLIEQHELPTISVDLNFDGGSVTDPPGKEGLASVCVSMLTEGTEKLDKLAFKEKLADTASSVYSYATSDTHGVGMRTLSKHLDAVYPLFVDTLMAPGMRQQELERLVQRSLESLRQTKGAPGPVAARVAEAVMYGARHPRGRIVTETSYQAITIDDCKKFHEQYFKPQRARLFVVGDMTEAQVRKYFDKQALREWRGKQPRAVRLPKARPQAGKVFFVDLPGSAQAAIRVMHIGPRRKARDYMATWMMSRVLGGGFTSRINMNLREDKGYTYGARGGMRYSRDHGMFFMSTRVRANSAYQSVLELMEEMSAMKRNKRPISDQELQREKDSSIQGLPSGFATARRALSQYRGLVYYGLPLNYYNKFPGKISKVRLRQVAAAARRHLKPDEVKIVVVGDADAALIHRVGDEDVPLMEDGKPVTVLAGLKGLVKSGALGGKGSLVILDADGAPVTAE